MPGLRKLLPALALYLSLIPATEASSQVRLEGIVIDHGTEIPITGVTIAILDPDGDELGRSFTDASGSFKLVVPETRGFSIDARRIGYKNALTPVVWTGGDDSLELEVRLHPDAVVLAPLEVTAWARNPQPSPVLEDFKHRIETGFGDYITREDIEKLDPNYVTDLLARLPGVTLVSSGSGRHRGITMSRSVTVGGRTCPVQIFVDGMLLNAGNSPASLDDAVSPNSVEGIEVYRGLATMPAEFVNPNSRCGVVAVWTRRGG